MRVKNSSLSKMGWRRVAALLEGELPASLVRPDAPLGGLSTYRVGGSASILIEVGSREDLLRLATLSSAEQWSVMVIGLGSNLLVADAGFTGIVLRLGSAFATTRIESPRVYAGGAAPLPVVARRCAAAGLGGFSWAVGVPGSIGGAVRMNAGGHGSDMSQVARWVEIVDLLTGLPCQRDITELRLSYRSSELQQHEVIVEVELMLCTSDCSREEERIREIVTWRRVNQPGGANTGSVFINPADDSAGRLIEAAGCKDLRIGTAAVSSLHANFIQADPGGSADDVFALMREVAERVESHSGVRLHPETQLVGFDETTWSPA